MSGICGIVQTDGAAVDRPLLLKMTSFMTFRGPDAQEVWSEGRVGFGHTLLRSTAESIRERQPASLDGRIWITADARIDGQAELKKKLSALGRTNLEEALDHELILHSYHAWGEACVEHLIGDFAFAIWDEPKQTLFCARDHFGVKPFFYAQLGQTFVFSNTLECVRQHPDVSETLNDLAVADFLLFDGNQDPGTTTFADIHRLPPAHCLIYAAGSLITREYWTLPTNIPVKYRKKGEYGAEFKALLETVVADRLRADSIGFELSGGLDSPALAAASKTVLSRAGKPFKLRGYTIVYDRLIPDEERYFSRLVAEKLGIQQQVCAADDYELFARYDEAIEHMPEPWHDPTAIRMVDLISSMPADQRIVITGWDGDALLSESPKPYFAKLLQQREYWKLMAGVIGYALWQKVTGPVGWVKWAKRKLKERRPAVSYYPIWFNPELEKRFGLKKRFEEFRSTPVFVNPLRPYALRSLRSIQTSSSFFEFYDPGRTRQPIEYRHPLMDLRLIHFCLSLPPYPWCVKKHLLREALRGVLPEAVRRRPKALLAGHPHLSLLQEHATRALDAFLASEALSRYIDRARVPPVSGQTDPDTTWINLRPLSLDYWLRRQHKSHEVKTS
jgi:asparagine synthase (glutamine-hydrolysing)